MSSSEQRSCFSCENPVDDQPCRYCTCEQCGYYNRGVPCLGCNSEAENSFTYEPTPYSYNDSPNFSDYPLQPQYDTYFCELCGNDTHYGYDCPPQVPFRKVYGFKVKQALEEGQNQPENVQELLLKLLNDLQILNKMQLKQEEQAAKICTPYWKCPIFDDDDDEEYTIQVREYYKNSPIAITPDFPITDSLIMEDEHLDTISETESDEENESSVEDPNLTPSESEDLSDIEKSDLIESLLNRDTLIVSSPKFDSLLEEFSGELAHIDVISLEIYEADFDLEVEIRLFEKLLYANSSPRPPEELNSKNYDVAIESFSPSPIPVEGSNSLMEEIDIFLAPDDSIPPGIENDDYDSEGDILEELLNNDSLSLPGNESFHFDRYYDPSSPRPPAKPPDDDGIYFDAEPVTRILTVKVVDDISERYVLKPRILPTQPTRSLCPVIDTLLPFSFKNEDKVFNPGILASKEEKSPHLLSHRGFKAFQLIFDFSESPMMIYGGNIPILDVPSLHFYPP
ncbi:hypothetical protein Tco_1009776 [Tanacetum coccineum]